MKLTYKVLGLALLTSLAACSSDDDSTSSADETAPVIESVLINGDEMLNVDENEVHNGDALEIQIAVSDNEALSQLQVEIHEGGDHEHRINKSGDDEEALTFGPRNYDISGQMGTQTITIVDTLDHEVGEYHLTIVVLDEAANRTEIVEEFHLENEGDEHGHDDHHDDEHEEEHDDHEHEGEHEDHE